MSVYIYALVDVDGLPRYVGQSICPWARKVNHSSRFAARNVMEWIDTLKARGIEPTLVVLYKVPTDEDPDECERRFIRLLSTTAELLNWRPNVKRLPRTRTPTRGGILLGNTGLTQASLAERLGVDQSVICRWISGERTPSLEHALDLLEIFGIPLLAWKETVEFAA